MTRIEIKPLSVNEAWQGRRFKTDAYRSFEKKVLFLLPNKVFDFKGKKLEVEFEFGFSNTLSDIDNPTKNFLDCLCKKYKFDDRQIVRLIINKSIVPKGNEFIAFSIKTIE